jgi:hypothetical protein
MRSSSMSPRLNRSLLQAAIAVFGIVPVAAGAAGILLGPHFAGHTVGDPSLDSHFRYLSGLLLAIGLLFWGAIPTIERQGWLVRALTLIVFIGGLGRAVSALDVGAPDLPMRLAFIMELLVTPAICLWQMQVERQAMGGGAPRGARPLHHPGPALKQP